MIGGAGVAGGLIGFCSLAISAVVPLSAEPHSDPIKRIAFGSCNRQNRAQPLWSRIVADSPELWIWLGDNIYADTADTSVMRAKYRTQLQNPGYRRLTESCPVIGTWDDHDYGKNNAGKEFTAKRESQQLLLDFLGEPQSSERHQRDGIYTTYSYGPPGQQVRVILLDTRYHREPPGADADVLGTAQWHWLEKILQESTAAVHLVVSSIQVLPEDHSYEKWANFPEARKRLLKTLIKSGAAGVLFLSGDRHLAEISRLRRSDLASPFYEITSSGMTHSYWSLETEPNRHRLGSFFNQLNYGIIEFKWHENRVVLRLQIRDQNGKTALQEEVEFPLPRGGHCENKKRQSNRTSGSGHIFPQFDQIDLAIANWISS